MIPRFHRVLPRVAVCMARRIVLIVAFDVLFASEELMHYSETVQIEPKQTSNHRRMFSYSTAKLCKTPLRSATPSADPFRCSCLYHVMSTFACPLPCARVIKVYMLGSEINLKSFLSYEQNLCSCPFLLVSIPIQMLCAIGGIISRSPLAICSDSRLP